MNRRSANEKILQRLWNYIVFDKEDSRNGMCFEDRQVYANNVIRTFREDDGESRRNAESLRQLYIYKLASDKNLLAELVYPKAIYENWMYSTIYCTTQHINTFAKIFHTFTHFLIGDISSLELFAVEGLRTLPDLIPTPAHCPVYFPPDPQSTPDHPSSYKSHGEFFFAFAMPFWGGKKSEDKEHLLEANRREERREREREQERKRQEEKRAEYMGKSRLNVICIYN
jgi:hypothetical protein